MKAAFFAAVLALGGCVGQVEEEKPAAAPSACHDFGEAPQVTTIRQPVSQEQPHTDCAEVEKAPNGQRVFCCMGADFDAWYASLRPAEAPKCAPRYVGVSAAVAEACVTP